MPKICQKYAEICEQLDAKLKKLNMQKKYLTAATRLQSAPRAHHAERRSKMQKLQQNMQKMPKYAKIAIKICQRQKYAVLGPEARLRAPAAGVYILHL